MKLYTEEQVRQAFIAGMEFIAVDPMKYEQDTNEYMNSITPIELPSDDEIGEFINTFTYTKQLDDGQFNDGLIYGATIGIDWMRDKIQGGNNEP